jgi:undecaprenyl-diphosphatase
VSALGHVTELLGVPGRLDPTLRLRGWRELGALVGAHRRAMPAPERTFLLAERYQVTSELAFYVEGHPPAYNVNLGRRLNQYDFWEGPERHRQWDAIYVQENVGSLDTRIVGAFDRIEGPFRVDVRRRGLLIRTVAIYRGYGFRGLAPPPGALSY